MYTITSGTLRKLAVRSPLVVVYWPSACVVQRVCRVDVHTSVVRTCASHHTMLAQWHASDLAVVGEKCKATVFVDAQPCSTPDLITPAQNKGCIFPEMRWFGRSVAW